MDAKQLAGTLYFPAPQQPSDWEARLALGRASAERAASQHAPSPEALTPAPSEPSALASILAKAHEYIDPTQYFGGSLETALAPMGAGPRKVVTQAMQVPEEVAERFIRKMYGKHGAGITASRRLKEMGGSEAIDPDWYDMILKRLPQITRTFE